MAFWSKERLEKEQALHPLVTPVAPIEQCAFALGVAAEYAISSPEGGGARRLAEKGVQITIPPGQFALLLTEEKVTVPANAIALISMKAKFKLRGLINVSGFHVDPGFNGRLKFAVYNAGSIAIDLDPGRRLFLIWYADLDQPTKAVYEGSHQGQDRITDEDITSIRGIVVSPAGINSRVLALEETVKSEIRRVENKIETHQNWSRPILTGLAVGLAFVLINALAKPWLEGLVKGHDSAQQGTVIPARSLPDAAPLKP